MSRLAKSFLLFFLMCFLFTPASLFSHEIHKAPIADSYNNQMISDAEFRAKNTMTESQIQTFLVSKGSALANYTIPTDGSVPTTIGWNYTVEGRGWSAAKVIYWSAQWYDINPQVLLATLNKESSLVTSGTLTNLTYAMGYACPETASCNPFYKGFARQMDGAAYQFYYNFKYSELNSSSRVGQYRKGNTATVDGKATYISNSATASLYRYTPHRPDSGWLTSTWGSHYYGNYNFIYFYNLWFRVTDLFPVTASLGFSNLSPAAGETLNAVFSIKNNSSSSITIDASIADRNTQTNQWNSFPSQNVTLAAGETRQLQFSKQVLYPGPHKSWISIRYGGTWYDATTLNYQLVNYTYNVKPVTDALPVSASLGFSNLSPAAGETMTVVYSLKNTSPSSITVDASLADKNTQTGQWNSASHQTVTIAPGATRQLLFTRTMLHPGPHTSSIVIRQGVIWYTAKPLAGQLVNYSYYVREPNVRINYYYFNTLPPLVGQQFSANLSITNLESRPISLDALGVPVYNLGTGSWNTMNSTVKNLNLSAGQTHSMTAVQSLGSGEYQIWPSICISTYCFTPKDANGTRPFWRGGI